MGAVEQTGAPARPAHGGRCPRCNTGVLYVIASTEAGELLRCFNCDTDGSIPREGDYLAVTELGDATPTGFQMTRDQLAAKREAGIDPFAPHEAAAGSSSAPAGQQQPLEPHEQHDVVPPADEQQPPPPGGAGG